MVKYKTFTKALTLFCILVFIHTVISDDYLLIRSFLKYIIIVFVIIILMMYNKILSLSHHTETEFKDREYLNVVHKDQLNSEAFKNQFKFLTDTVLSLSSLINSKCKSAIYIIDPEKQEFILETNDNNYFL